MNIPDAWDVILVGDGAGSGWGAVGGGWACVMIEKGSLGRKVFHGAMNDCTVNLAEPMAYLAPLSWYVSKIDKDTRMRQVHILTDSSYVANRGNGETPDSRVHAVLWAAYGLLARQGLQLHWHWIPRESVELNRLVDTISREARIGYKKIDVEVEARKMGLNVDNCNAE